MNIQTFWKRFTILLTILCLAGGLMSCGLNTGQESEPEGQIDLQEPAADEAEPTSEPTEPSPTESPEEEESGSQADEGSAEEESIVEPEFGSDTLPCPAAGTTLMLGFDHALTVNYAETSITHFLHQGWLMLEVTDDAGTIVSMAGAPIPYTMEGMMSKDCSLESAGTMTPSAHGSCEAGVVSLIIEENWSALEGEMTCIDTDGDVDILPFNAPPMGMRVHSGANGTGEIFYLVAGGEGYSTMRPFLEGDGYHTWTLYTEEIPLVPLVPEE